MGKWGEKWRGTGQEKVVGVVGSERLDGKEIGGWGHEPGILSCPRKAGIIAHSYKDCDYLNNLII